MVGVAAAGGEGPRHGGAARAEAARLGGELPPRHLTASPDAAAPGISSWEAPRGGAGSLAKAIWARFLPPCPWNVPVGPAADVRRSLAGLRVFPQSPCLRAEFPWVRSPGLRQAALA